MKRVTLKNMLTGEVVRVHPTTAHPDSSYGMPVWVDERGVSYGSIMPPLGYQIIKMVEEVEEEGEGEGE